MAFTNFISRTSVRTLVTYIILGAMLPSFLVVLLLEWHLFTEKRSATETFSADMAHFVAIKHQDAIHSGRTFLEAVAGMLPEGENPAALSARFTRIQHDNPQYAYLTLADPDGTPVASSAALSPDMCFASCAHVSAALQTGRFAIGRAMISKTTGIPVLPFAEPVLDTSGNVTRLLMAGLRLDDFTDFFASLHVPANTCFLLLDQDGATLLRSPQIDTLPMGENMPDHIWSRILKTGMARTTFDSTNLLGQAVTYSFRPMSENGVWPPPLGILVGMPAPSPNDLLMPVVLKTLAALGVISCIVFGVGLSLSNRFYVRGMESLEAQVARVTEGRHLRPLFIPEGSREITSLGRAFNLMVRTLQEDHAATLAAEQKALESETNFCNFFGTMTDLLWVASRAGEILFVNDAVCETLGYSRDQLLGMPLTDLHPADQRLKAEQIFRDMLNGHCTICSLPLLTREGRHVPAETRVWQGAWDGEPCIFGISKNLTTEQEARTLFERMFHNNPAMMVLTRLPEQTFADINEAFVQVCGYSRDELLGRAPREMHLFADETEAFRLERELRQQGAIANQEVSLRCKDGCIRHGIISGEIITSSQGSFFLGVMVDISKRRQAEDRLRESEERLDLALFGTNAGLWDWNIRTDDLIVNDRWMNMLGYTRAELEPVSIRTWEELCHPEDLRASDALVTEHLAGRTEYYSCEVRLKHKDGHWVWVRDRGRCVSWNGDGAPLRMVGTHVDITARRQDQELREGIERIVRHDLRSPAGNAVNIARLLADSPGLPPEDRALARQLEISGQEMLDTLNLSLDLYKIESGQYVLSPKSVDVQTILQEALRPLQLVPAHRARQVRTDLPADSTALAQGSPFLLRMALRNLLQNALEASPQDGVVEVEVHGNDGNGGCRIAISNDGVVPADIREQFFEKYVTRGKFAGTGLGTYSARLMIEAQHGSIAMHTSDETSRTVITIILPAA